MIFGNCILCSVALNVLCLLFFVDGRKTSIELQPMQTTKSERFYLVAFFPIRMKPFINRSGFVWREVLKYAFIEMLETFEKEDLFLNLDLLIFDTQNRLDVTTNHIIDVLSSRMYDTENTCCTSKAFSDNIIGFLGPASSKTSNHVLNLLSFDHYPVISYSATSVRFQNKNDYPDFLRTIPSDDVQVKLMLDVLIRYNWTYVAVIAQDDEYGRTGMSEMKKVFSERNICTAFERTIDIQNKKQTEHVLELIKKDPLIGVIILWIDGVHLPAFLENAQRVKFYNKTLILAESANEHPRILSYDINIIQGLLSIVPKSGQYQEFEEHFRQMTYGKDANEKPWLKSFFEESLRINSSDASIGDHWEKLPMTKNGFVYDSLQAYGQAIKRFVKQHEGTLCNVSHTGACLTNITNNRLDFLQNYLMNISFKNLQNQTVSFDSKGNINSSQYWISTIQPSIVNENLLAWKRVGQWSSDTGLQMLTETFTWNNGQTTPPSSNCGTTCKPGYEHSNGSSECCWTCIPCQENTVKSNHGRGSCVTCPPGSYTNKQHTECILYKEKGFDFTNDIGIIMVCFSSLSILIIIFFTVVFILYRKTPIVMSSQLLISLVQFFFLALLNLLVPLSISKLMGYKCLLYGTLIPLVVTFAIIPTVLKTQRLNRIFRAKRRIKHHQYFHAKDLRLIICLLSVQAFITLIYSAFNSYDKPVTKIDPEKQTFTINCNFSTFVYIQSGFVFTIVLICGISAFRARSLPHNYNETRMVAYSMFITCVILVFSVPLYVSTGLESQTLVILYALLLIDLNITLCMYSPKVWLILFRPKLNTTKHFTMARMKHVNESVAKDYRKSHCNISSNESSPSLHSCRNSMLVIQGHNITAVEERR